MKIVNVLAILAHVGQTVNARRNQLPLKSLQSSLVARAVGALAILAHAGQIVNAKRNQQSRHHAVINKVSSQAFYRLLILQFLQALMEYEHILYSIIRTHRI